MFQVDTAIRTGWWRIVTEKNSCLKSVRPNMGEQFRKSSSVSERGGASSPDALSAYLRNVGELPPLSVADQSELWRSIDAATDEDLDRLCCNWTLKIGGKERRTP